uniref:Uncharacterized protein n=1 Tax=Gopherus agassizii TaxID=38772 RepID=A0A452IVX0_9SAUR
LDAMAHEQPLQTWVIQLTSENQLWQKQVACLPLENTALQTRLAQPCSPVPLPEWFDGNHYQFWTSINQCHHLFMMQPQSYNSDRAKVSPVISLLVFLPAMSVLFNDPHRTQMAEAALKGRAP